MIAKDAKRLKKLEAENKRAGKLLVEGGAETELRERLWGFARR